MAIGPALSSAAANTEPSSSQPRFGVTSPHAASGPGSVRSAPPGVHDADADQRGEGDGEPVRPDAR